MLARGIIIVNENSYYKDSLLQKWTLNFLLVDSCSADDPIGFQNVAFRLSKKPIEFPVQSIILKTRLRGL